MVHPVRWWAIGANVRGPVYLNTSGTVNATAPSAVPMPIAAGAGDLLDQPAVGGARRHAPHEAARRRLRGRRRRVRRDLGKLERGAGRRAEGEHPGRCRSSRTSTRPSCTTITTPSRVRLGASYNVALPAGVLSFRVGGYYDSSATERQGHAARLRHAAQAGGDLRGSATRCTASPSTSAYAYVHEFDRVVTDGDIAPVNGAAHGDSRRRRRQSAAGGQQRHAITARRTSCRSA